MNLTLPEDIQKQIDQRVRSGRYRSPEEVITAAVANLGTQEHLEEMGPLELESVYPGIKAKLAEGLQAARAGKLSDGEAFFDELQSAEDEQTSNGGRKTA